MSLKGCWKELRGEGLERGVHKFDGRGELAHHRFHLRVDSESKGALLVDASGIIFLNGTALDHVRCILEGRTDRMAVRYLNRRYRKLDKATALEDLHSVNRQLIGFVKGGLEVIETIGSARPTIGKDDFPAPYRMDLALTYRCQNDCSHCYNVKRELNELSIEEWKAVIAKTWEVGIPQIVFTGGEPTSFTGLADLIACSEGFGQVTGLITNGRNLRQPGYLRDLVRKGLDHVQITVLSDDEAMHDRLVGGTGAWKETMEGLRTALAEDLYVSTNTTIMRPNLDRMESTMRYLISLGVKHIAFNGVIRSGGGVETEGVTSDEMSDVLIRLSRIADEAGVKLIWYTPTPYCELNPVNLGLGIKQCTACSMNMAVEPDGTVLPCQSYYEPLGNILRDPWDKIWDHDLCRNIRERKYLDEECSKCGMMDTCGGGCPLARENGDYVCLDRNSNM